MGDYKLKIELSFQSVSEAQEIQRICKDLTEIDAPNPQVLINKLEAQVELSVSYIEATIERAEALKPQAKKLLDETSLTIAKLGKVSKELSDITSSTEIDDAIKQAWSIIEACSFFKDMLRVRQRIITGGKVTLLGPDDLGNMAVLNDWEV